MMEGPLTELRNQRVPRRKMAHTYGKKKTTTTGATHRDLFGADKIDIENKLADLSLKDRQDSPDPTKTAIKPSTKEKKRPDKKEKTGILADATLKRTPISEGLPMVQSLKDDSLRSANLSKVIAEDFADIQPLLALSKSSVDLFNIVATKLLKHYNIEKVGEGSFAEVFELTAKSDSTENSLSSSSSKPSLVQETSIVKVIPLKVTTSSPDTFDRLSTVESVAREIRVLQTLDDLHGFTAFRGVRLVVGAWPNAFLDAFRRFRRAHRGRAQNRAPDDDFDAAQIYALVEMNNVGTEISIIKRPSVFQVHDIFWMSAVFLAQAEQKWEFEHRDLHLSNVCIKPFLQASTRNNQDDAGGEGSTQSEPKIDIDRSILAEMTESNIPTSKLGLSNIDLSVIDYTISRCNLAPITPNEKGNAEEIAYDPLKFLSQPQDSTGSAKPETAIQMATYRKVKAVLEFQQRRTGFIGDKWAQFAPQTNVVWLGYLIQILTKRAKGRCKRYYIVKNSSRTAKALQEEMWDTLASVEDLVMGVDPTPDDDSDDGSKTVVEGGKEWEDEELERVPGSARELVARAVEEGWVKEEELEWLETRLNRES